MKDKLIAMLKALGLYTDDKAAQIEAAIADLKIEEPQAPAPVAPKAEGKVDNETRDLIAALQGQVKSLTDALAAETQARKQQADAIANQAKKDREAKITGKLEQAKKDGKITPAQEAHYKKLLEADFDTTASIIDGLPVNPNTKKSESKQDSKQDGHGSGDEQRTGLMRSAPKGILDKVMEFGQVSEN